MIVCVCRRISDHQIRQAAAEGADQLQWSALIQERGLLPRYSKLSSTFNLIIGDAVQRMVLTGDSPENAADEILTKYADAVAKAQ